MTPDPSAPGNEILGIVASHAPASATRSSCATPTVVTRPSSATTSIYEKAPGRWEEVDLNFRSDGGDHVMDRHDLEVRITGARITATERESGKGIRWIMPMPPGVSGRSASYSSGDLQWEYTTAKSGLKLGATVSAGLIGNFDLIPLAL